MISAPIVIIAVATLLQLFICHLSLWWFIAIIGRLLFSLRMVGAIFKLKTSLTFEVVAVIAKILWVITFGSNSFEWSNFILFVTFCIICSLAEIFDEMLYVYITDEDEDFDTVDITEFQAVDEDLPSKKSRRKVGNKNGTRSRDNKDKGNKRNGSAQGKGKRRKRSSN